VAWATTVQQDESRQIVVNTWYECNASMEVDVRGFVRAPPMKRVP
jgi:hypothetical protein